MTATEDVDVRALHTVTRDLLASLASIGPEQWTMATPCTDWDLSALVDHVTGGNWFTVAILSGQSADDAMAATMDRFGGGSATREAAIESLHDQLAAFLRPDVLDQTWSHVVGDLRGRQILRLRLHDLIVHSWDIAETLHPGATVADDLVRWGLDELTDEESSTARHFGIGDLGSTDVPATAYLEAFGR